jgi:hypothetical protein
MAEMKAIHEESKGSFMNRGASIGLIVVGLIAAIVLIGPFGGLIGPFGRRESNDFSPEYLQGQAAIETVFDSDGTGRFTANAIAICTDGDVTRLSSGATGTVFWSEDEYRCGSGAFIVRSEFPREPGAGDSEPVLGNWSLLSGTDDYDGLTGGGTVSSIWDPTLTESLTGVIDSGY